MDCIWRQWSIKYTLETFSFIYISDSSVYDVTFNLHVEYIKKWIFCVYDALGNYEFWTLHM